MNVLARIVTVATGILLVFAIPGYSQEPPNAQWEQYEVLLVPQKDNKLLPVLRGGKSCAQKDHYGCMRFTEGAAGVIRFYLPGANEDEVSICDSTKPAIKQVITKIELTDQWGGTTSDDPNRKKGDFTGPPASWLKQTFPSLKANGAVYSENAGSGFNQVYIINLNNHSGPKEIWYRVEAKDCQAPHDPYTTDPRVDNEGFPPP